jgi:hypothetical protein
VIDVASTTVDLARLQFATTSFYVGGIPGRTLELIHVRASQINGCITHGITAATSRRPH